MSNEINDNKDLYVMEHKGVKSYWMPSGRVHYSKNKEDIGNPWIEYRQATSEERNNILLK